MKLLYKSLIVLLLAVSPSDNTLTFTLNCSDTLVDDVPSGVSSTIGIQESVITWTRHHGNNDTTTVLDITAITGNWDEGTSTGQLSYTLVDDGYQAEFSLTGNGSGATAQFVFHTSETEYQTYRFSVTGIDY